MIALRYILPEHVIRPPHSANIIATTTFEKLGFDDEVIEVIKRIPALGSDVTWGWQHKGIELLPESKAVTYFESDRHLEWIEELRWGDNTHSYDTKLLPPWLLRLTAGYTYSGSYGVDLIYNTKDGMIIEWEQKKDDLWDQYPSRPASIVLHEFAAKLQDLEWIPLFDPDNHDGLPSRRLIEDPISNYNRNLGHIPLRNGHQPRIPPDTQAALAYLVQFCEVGELELNSMRQDINYWRTLKKLYRDCGWGTEKFDGDAFEGKRAGFLKAYWELDGIRYQDELVEILPPLTEEERAYQFPEFSLKDLYRAKGLPLQDEPLSEREQLEASRWTEFYGFWLGGECV